MPRHNMTSDGPIPFTAQEEADRDTQEQAWQDGAVVRNARQEIARLESQITIRRIREAYSDSTWMDAQEALIVIERSKL